MSFNAEDLLRQLAWARGTKGHYKDEHGETQVDMTMGERFVRQSYCQCHDLQSIVISGSLLVALRAAYPNDLNLRPMKAFVDLSGVTGTEARKPNDLKPGFLSAMGDKMPESQEEK